MALNWVWIGFFTVAFATAVVRWWLGEHGILQALMTARASGAGALTPGELAQVLTLSPSATTTLIDRLERAGHVERHHDQQDRRRVSLTMTEHAGTEGRAMFGPMAAAMIRLLADFDDAEVATISRFLAAATDVVETAEPG